MKKMLFLVLAVLPLADLAAQEYKLVWSDEFNYSGLPDTSKWGNEVGYIRNRELQYYTKQRIENSVVSNGNLMIIGRREAFKGMQYTSASLTTDGKQSWTYGKIEARMKLPVGQGMW
nr:glycoside hydrolase family 16 protein [Bacteroidales bacterium]